MTFDEQGFSDFVDTVKGWRDYCRQVPTGSTWNRYLACEPYQKLVALGREALPYIHEVVKAPDDEWSSFPGIGWFCLVQDITGNELNPPVRLDAYPDLLNHYTKLWLAQRGHTRTGDTFPVEEDTDIGEIVLRALALRAFDRRN